MIMILWSPSLHLFSVKTRESAISLSIDSRIFAENFLFSI